MSTSTPLGMSLTTGTDTAVKRVGTRFIALPSEQKVVDWIMVLISRQRQIVNHSVCACLQQARNRQLTSLRLKAMLSPLGFMMPYSLYSPFSFASLISASYKYTTKICTFG